MDAPDDNRDIKLYRASADLLPEISRRLDELLTGISNAGNPPAHQPWIADSQTQKLISLLDPFQEWPQLLDPVLPKLVNSLVDVFLRYLVTGGHEDPSQARAPRSGLSLLPCSICCILNALCRVRGAKVITRFLNNEPRYLEPMLRALLLNKSIMVWQERYIILLWLSHVVLTPFDLRSISSSDEPLFTQAEYPGELEHLHLPTIALALISASLRNLVLAGKERESASRLLVRMALRPDMQRLGLLGDFVMLVSKKLQDYTRKPTSSMYESLGYLSVLLGVMKSGSADDVLPFLTTTFDLALKAATAESAEFSLLRASAPARKMLVAILRTSILHAITLNAKHDAKAISDDALYWMLEDIIQYLLDALGDKDTPVRLAASKSLSLVAQGLDEGMKAEVAQTVLDTLDEDVLYQKPDSADPMPLRLLTDKDMQRMSRNVTAVNPLKWQGLLLTLGHLLFRRTAPRDQLSRILKSLLSGLDFEQRSAGGTSIGGSVRDAACFGLWSLARKYATSELQSLEPASVLPAFRAAFSVTDETSVLQVLADRLVVSACLDPSGNIRRGSSAALQELIGRHPDTIVQGIALVQVVDYHAVARRSRAMLDVAQAAAELANVYRWALLNALLEWRGVRAVDDDSRRNAAAAISRLVSLGPFSNRLTVLDIAQMQLSRLPVQNSKTFIETRHGLLMTISRTLDTMNPASIANLDFAASSNMLSLLQLLWEGIKMDGQALGSLRGRSTSELILEGAASLISSLARGDPEGLLKLSEQVIQVLDVCLTRADHDISLAACANAAFELFSRLPVPQKVNLVRSWLNLKGLQHASFSCKGRILALGNIYVTLPENLAASHTEPEEGCKSRVFARLTDFIQGDWPIETQVIALRALTSTIPHLREERCEEPLCAALDNYANDQRGDIGALARLEAVKAVSALLPELAARQNDMSDHHNMQPLVKRLFRLAGEKLDKLRFEAWKCIEGFLAMMKINSTQKVYHVVDASSDQYYSALLQFMGVPWLQSCIIQGIAHSVASGTEELMRIARLALVDCISRNTSTSQVLSVLDTLVALLEDSYSDDRQATPLLETLAFVLEQFIDLEPGTECKLPTRKLWNVVRKAHFKSTNIRKVEAALKIYGALAIHSDLRVKALGKLIEMLLHPYPSIRNAAADALYTELQNDVLLMQDWLRPPTELKEAVMKLNKETSELAGRT